MGTVDINHFLAHWSHVLNGENSDVRTVTHPNGGVFAYSASNAELPIHLTPTAVCDLRNVPCVVVTNELPGLSYPIVFSIVFPFSLEGLDTVQWGVLSTLVCTLLEKHFKHNSSVNVTALQVSQNHPTFTVTADGVTIGLTNGTPLYEYYFTPAGGTVPLYQNGVEVHVPLNNVYSPQCIAYLPSVVEIARGNIKPKARVVASIGRTV